MDSVVDRDVAVNVRPPTVINATMAVAKIPNFNRPVPVIFFLAINGYDLSSSSSSGTHIHKIKYAKKPVPKNNAAAKNIARHIHVASGVAFPSPPHTPPIQLSWDDFFKSRKFCQRLT
jgi:hypothetical protein